ncbi:MAG: hypothetical protein U0802_18765 [Candidatus Binatia bacterium]
MAAVAGEDHVAGAVEGADHRHGAGLLPDAGVGGAEQLALGEQRQQALLDGADQQHAGQRLLGGVGGGRRRPVRRVTRHGGR